MTMWLAKDGTVRHAAVIARLRRDVIAKQPVDDRERQSLRAFVEAFDQLDEPFAQESNSIHVTGSALVVGPRGVVLLKHKRLGFWLQPGGHIDPGESPWAAALREAREETGLEVHFVGPLDDEGVPELLHVDVHPGGRGHTHLDVRYLLDGGDADPDPPEGESQEIGWYDWEAAVEQADPGLEGILRFLQRRGLDLHE
jgi:8-oxo-dGTP pyrophosphatase MutT (NUDIX family)